MIRVVERVDVAAPVETTWAAMTDWAGQGAWMLGTTVRVTSGDGRGVGSTLAAFTGLARIGFTDHMEITEWRPPVRCAVRHTGWLVRGTGVFEVVDRGAGSSTFVWREDLNVPRLLWAPVSPVFRAGLRASLRRFAAFAQARA
ncbi:SRPBCC family protein [Actinokineospora globicatena]|uniref:SRPBCC family protein n=1 Tax=Actinokineospora globicatena TaxID=103729 RepID=UPI0020A2A82B|nr:SRPBCC family protein [Actinokineospora globicatena]MCP2300459.1 Polyketide cyclase / dehydrase and lipid transport [Actinokineospora globicatena]GLW80993.1 polyketide cyclase [Actinokineospora globicatena]GLW88186.1 polyketide cyclase [Actinokineospora globicatena]